MASLHKHMTGLHTGIFGGGKGDLTDDLRMYMRCCHAYILVNKSHNNAVITNFFFLLVYVIILFVLYILHVYCYGILGGGGGGGGGGDPSAPPPLCMQPCMRKFIIYIRYESNSPGSNLDPFCVEFCVLARIKIMFPNSPKSPLNYLFFST